MNTYNKPQLLTVIIATIAVLLTATIASASAVPQKAEHVIFPISLETLFSPSGWMGDGDLGAKSIYLSNENVIINELSKVATKVDYHTKGNEGWAGIYWLHPNDNWGDKKGLSLDGANEITFFARGESGTEVVEFLAGGINGKYPDTFRKTLGKISLSTQWQQYSLSLADLDLSNVCGAFAWSAPMPANGRLVFYLADIQIK